MPVHLTPVSSRVASVDQPVPQDSCSTKPQDQRFALKPVKAEKLIFRAISEKKLKEARQAAAENNSKLGYVLVSIADANSGNLVDYVFPQEPIDSKPCYDPKSKGAEQLIEDKNIKGQFKRLDYKDKKMVSLVPLSKKHPLTKKQTQGKFQENKNVANYRLFADKPGFSFNIWISETQMLARNAGINLREKMRERGNGSPLIPGLAFRQAASDLEKLHAENVRIIDVKPENMCYKENKENKPRVIFIDVDDRYYFSPVAEEREAAPADFLFTNQYTTPKLMEGVRKLLMDETGQHPSIKDQQTGLDYARVHDYYGFLLAYIESTTDSDQLHAICRAGIPLQSKESIVTEENRKLFTDWIAQNVNFEHAAKVETLLEEPEALVEKMSQESLPLLTQLLNFRE